MALPLLPKVNIASLPATPPTTLIRTEEDVQRWQRSKGFSLYMLFLHRLNEAVAGHMSDADDTNSPEPSPAVTRTIAMLDTIESWVDEVPPQPTPQRFGNLAFRDWGRLLEERVDGLLRNLLPESLYASIPLISPYLLGCFGSFGRIDYGSGHELCFAIFLLCLTLLRFFQPTPEEERALVLKVFERYLRVVWRLQDVYKLEPAGSHGVWGLDDYHFLPYLWGSAQLRNETDLPPTSILAPPPLPPTNLYYTCVNRIHLLKHGGPFHEHSPQLYSIATGVTVQNGGWRKVNGGMMKMYLAEVLSKRVVVQHTPLGGLMSWDEEDRADAEKGKPVTAGPGVLPVRSPGAGGVRSSHLGNMGPPSIPISTVAPGRIPPLGTQTQRVGPTSFPSATSIPTSTVFPTPRPQPPP